jgi:hypothetical protein
VGRIVNQQKSCSKARDVGRVASTGRDECPPRRGHVVLCSVLCPIPSNWFNQFTHARDHRSRPRGPTSHHKPIRWPVVSLHVGRPSLRRSVALARDSRACRPLLAVELVVAARALVACRRVADARSAAADLVGVRGYQGPGSRPAAAWEQQQGNRGEVAHGARANHAAAAVKAATGSTTSPVLVAHLTNGPNPDNTLTVMSRGADATARQA